MKEFIAHIAEALKTEELFKLTLSRPRSKNDALRNIYIRPIRLGEELVWQAKYRFQTNDQTQNFDSSEIGETVNSLLANKFYNADLFLNDRKITLLQSKKGRSKILTTKEINTIEVEDHDHQKQRLIREDCTYLMDLGISSTNGKVYGHAQDKYKQINKFVELLSNLLKDDTSIRSIHDMGSGKGYLTFALHDYLTQNLQAHIKTRGIEIRTDLVNKCNVIAEKNNLSGLSFELGSIEDYKIGKSDVVIALHACDIATDMAIAKGIEAQAKYIVVAPCCHKQIRKAIGQTDSNLGPLLQYGILKERQAEMITDTIRALLLSAQGYEVNVFEFISSEHTGKNIMITARKVGKIDTTALQKIEDLKSEFGIEYHYLERLLK